MARGRKPNKKTNLIEIKKEDNNIDNILNKLEEEIKKLKLNHNNNNNNEVVFKM